MEQQIQAFVLGVSAVIFIGMVVVSFRAVRKLDNLDTTVKNVEEWISRNDEMVNRRIDQEIDRVNRMMDTCISHTDSRVDKLESKVLANYGAKEILKG